MGLVAPSLTQALVLRAVQILAQDGPIVRMRAVFDNAAGAFAGRKAAHVGEPLLSDNDVEVVLCLVDMGAHGDDAGDAGGVGFRRPGGRRVHDGDLGGAQEIRRAAEPIEHAGAHDAGAVGVRVHVDFDGGIHPNDAQAADDFGRVGHLLRAQEQLARVSFPARVEALEAVWGEADGGGGGEVEVAAVEEVEEGVLQDFGPHFEFGEVVAVREAADDGVGDVADAGLEGEEVGGEAVLGDFVFEEVDEVGGDGAGGVVFGCVGLGLIGVVFFYHDGENSFYVLLSGGVILT